MDTAFLMYLALVVTVVAVVIVRNLPTRYARAVLAGLGLWLAYGGILGYCGVVGDRTLFPPGPAFLVLPVFLFVALVVTRTDAALRVALGIPLSLLLGLQVFRVGVEVVLHQLCLQGLAPRMLTYDGGNLDILVGLSAPVVAWLYVRGHLGDRAIFGWNVLGLMTLANVASRALLTAPGSLNLFPSEVPNLAIGTFPFTYIPGFMAPLALILHALSMRALLTRLRSSGSMRPAADRG